MAEPAAAGRKTRVGPYEVGKTIGEGSFAKVKHAHDSRTGAVRAIKVLDRSHVLRHKMVEQIKREISTLKLIKHPKSASQAASYYQTYITPYSGKAKLISPAVTSSTTAGLGLSWFKEFMSDCSSCGISGLAVHWYGNTADEFKSFVQQAISTATSYGLSEVWVTEFALSSDAGGVADAAATATFLQSVLPWLDAQNNVTRYSYFMCAENYLLTNNALNQAGYTYTS